MKGFQTSSKGINSILEKVNLKKESKMAFVYITKVNSNLQLVQMLVAKIFSKTFKESNLSVKTYPRQLQT